MLTKSALSLNFCLFAILKLRPIQFTMGWVWPTWAPTGRLDNSVALTREMNLATVFCTFSSRKERICMWIPISNSLGEETALVNVSISKRGLKCQRVMLSDMPNWGYKVICRYTDCTLQTFVKHYDSFLLFFRDSHFSCSRMPDILPVS